MRVADQAVRREPLHGVPAVGRLLDVEAGQFGHPLGREVDRRERQLEHLRDERAQLQCGGFVEADPADVVDHGRERLGLAADDLGLEQDAVGVQGDLAVRARSGVGEDVDGCDGAQQQPGLRGRLTDDGVARVLAVQHAAARQRPHARSARPHGLADQQHALGRVEADGVRGDAAQRFQRGGHETGVSPRHAVPIKSYLRDRDNESFLLPNTPRTGMMRTSASDPPAHGARCEGRHRIAVIVTLRRVTWPIVPQFSTVVGIGPVVAPLAPRLGDAPLASARRGRSSGSAMVAGPAPGRAARSGGHREVQGCLPYSATGTAVTSAVSSASSITSAGRTVVSWRTWWNAAPTWSSGRS